MKINVVPYRQLRSIHLVSAVVLMWGMSDALVSFLVPIADALIHFQIKGRVHKTIEADFDL